MAPATRPHAPTKCRSGFPADFNDAAGFRRAGRWESSVLVRLRHFLSHHGVKVLRSAYSVTGSSSPYKYRSSTHISRHDVCVGELDVVRRRDPCSFGIDFVFRCWWVPFHLSWRAVTTTVAGWGTSTLLQNEQAVTLSGSVGDGPVADASSRNSGSVGRRRRQWHERRSSALSNRRAGTDAVSDHAAEHRRHRPRHGPRAGRPVGTADCGALANDRQSVAAEHVCRARRAVCGVPSPARCSSTRRGLRCSTA